jgi:lysophospholipase L1-like esterase
MKRINVCLYLSIITNVIFFTMIARFVNGMGGLWYIKSRIERNGQKSKPNMFSYKQKNSIFRNLPHRSNEIFFIGDSNIQYGEWNDMLNNDHIRNRGISGDDIAGVTARINDITACKPQKIFLMIGMNNILNNQDDIQKVVKDYRYLIKKIKTKSPRTRLYIHSLLPTRDRNVQVNNDIKSVNKSLEEISRNSNATYINLHDLVEDADGNLLAKYSFDGVHFNGEGYDFWKSEIEELVSE